jgi:putative MATE family efflux protein
MRDRVEEFIANPRRALFAMAGPVTIAMFVQTMYNLVDTAFVGRLGAESIAALTFAFPLFFIVIGLNSGIGVGINSIVARRLGAKDKAGAENAAVHGLVLTAVFGVALLAAGLAGQKRLFLLLGAEGHVLDLSMDYMTIIWTGIIFMFPAYAINSIFSAQGDTRTPMVVQTAALVLNAVLDPVFIYPLGFGVQGAAIATVIALAFSLVLYVMLVGRRSDLKLDFRNFRFSASLCREILHVGAPASLMMFIMSIYVMFLNRFMSHFGTEHVAAFGLATRLESLPGMLIVGISVSLLTLVGMFSGARRFPMVKSISWYSLRIGIALTSLMGVAFFIAPSLFLGIFTDETGILALGAAYLRIDVLTFPMMAVTMIVSRVLQGLGFGTPGLVINLIRIFVVAVPLAYLFVFVLGYGYLSVAWAMVLGGVASNITAILWISLKFKEITGADSIPGL